VHYLTDTLTCLDPRCPVCFGIAAPSLDAASAAPARQRDATEARRLPWRRRAGGLRAA